VGSVLRWEIAVAKPKKKKYKLPDGVQIPAELIETGVEKLLRFTNSLILCGIRTNCLISGMSL
jgi:hypothetical protein